MKFHLAQCATWPAAIHEGQWLISESKSQLQTQSNSILSQSWKINRVSAEKSYPFGNPFEIKLGFCVLCALIWHVWCAWKAMCVIPIGWLLTLGINVYMKGGKIEEEKHYTGKWRRRRRKGSNPQMGRGGVMALVIVFTTESYEKQTNKILPTACFLHRILHHNNETMVRFEVWLQTLAHST